MTRFVFALAASAAGLQLPATRLARSSCPSMSMAGEEELLSRFGLPSEEISTSRRSALGLGLAAAAVPMLSFQGAAVADDAMFTLPALPYAYVRRRRRHTSAAETRAVLVQYDGDHNSALDLDEFAKLVAERAQVESSRVAAGVVTNKGSA